ncbi:hypothetical protein EJK55_0267 [Moraxella catarrhalis]|uniref:Uncharacterized protein n=1 Tax=Moraxella catarrhalis TaxID=480 RepID=A0ABY0BIA3_MORCA|nr:hypothetical protein EJK50_0594 [Moraxella catarrhalis]RUO13444.1 hypothetical protein EJK54_0209 [Moraxella catarrhalis]RUO15210.1 hypothetical protein EJK55_0267 [Moraxella catarrhalis]
MLVASHDNLIFPLPKRGIFIYCHQYPTLSIGHTLYYRLTV